MVKHKTTEGEAVVLREQSEAALVLIEAAFMKLVVQKAPNPEQRRFFSY